MNLNELNPKQYQAATTLEGPVLVLAGAGSGKTKMLTYRVANLIDHGVPPYHIMAITFTNKASQEMKERIRSLVGDQAEDVWIGTFHSTCVRILRRDVEKIGYARGFSIYDDEDQKTALKQVYKQLNLDPEFFPFREVQSIISRAKERLLSPDEWFEQSERSFRDQKIEEIYASYEAHLKKNNAMDFNDLIVNALELLVDNPPVLEYYRNRFRYIHVDEYQDTDHAQYRLVRLLTGEQENLCVVGDDDQSIYGWRGADIGNILNFERDYPNAAVIKLEQNYRSSANILEAANKVIAQNTNRREKSLWTEQEPGEKIRFYRAANAWEECRFVCESIRSMRKTGIAAHDIAVLYRTNFLSRSLETELISAGIPYRMYGGQRFYERKEIKDILAYLHVLLNPLDDISLQRIINVPKRSIGEASIAALADHAREKEISLLAACQDAEEVLSKRAATAVGRFTDLMGTLASAIAQQDPVDALETVISGALIREQYLNSQQDREENESRLRNIDELKNALQEYMSGNPEGTLQEFLEQASLMSSFDNVGDTEGAVTLMTLHGAKGLEFDNVFIIGLEDGTFPGERSVEDPERLEEERRLMYVGITRARKRLILSYAVSRQVYGMTRSFKPSMFLSAIPRALLDDGLHPAPQARTSSGAFATPAQRPRTVLGGRPAGSLGAGRKERLGNLTIPGVQRGFGTPVVVSSQAAQAPVSWKKGDRLRHKIFGTGTVLEVEGTGADTRLSVAFDRGGVRLLIAAKAPLLPLTE